MVSRYKGPLVAWRLADSRHPVFSGAGASFYGGRWNSPGFPVIYGAASFACAMLEKLVHAGIGKVPRTQVAVRIDIPGKVEIEEIDGDDVPGWDREDLMASRAYGDAWLRSGRTCILLVPSVVVPHENNVLINEMHADFRQIAPGPPEPVKWDRRLFEA
jgi:RES domain-containing protein